MFNLPNLITLTRLLLALVFTLALVWDGVPPIVGEDPAESQSFAGYFVPVSAGACVALWAFIVGALSDFFDGYLARKYNLVTNFGKLIDPLADKILVCSAFIYLTYVGLCPFWVSILIIFREFLVTGLRQIAVDQGYVMAADRSGKWKTGIQLAFCIACLVHIAYAGNLCEPFRFLSVGVGGEWLRAILMWLSVILTLWSGLNYCLQARRFLR